VERTSRRTDDGREGCRRSEQTTIGLMQETIMDKSDSKFALSDSKLALVVILAVIIAARVPEVGELFGKLFELLKRPFTGAPAAPGRRPVDVGPPPWWAEPPTDKRGGSSVRG
jgi:hypothetical protein